MMRKLAAWLNLAWHFARHVTTRLWLRPFRHGRDLLRFRNAMVPEGYVPLPPGARAEFVSYMGCVQCGLCAIPCASLQEAPASAWAEPWTFVAGASRSLDQAKLVVADLSECVDSAAPENVCPMGVPIRHMAESLRAMNELTDPPRPIQ